MLTLKEVSNFKKTMNLFSKKTMNSEVLQKTMNLFSKRTMNSDNNLKRRNQTSTPRKESKE